MEQLLYPISKRFNPRITAPFLQPRPLSVPPEQRNHCHGAVDIAGDSWAVMEVPYHAPENGRLYCMISIRPDSTRSWPREKQVQAKTRGGTALVPTRFLEYWYDTYGVVMFLHGKSGLLHVFAHTYGSQLFARRPVDPLGLAWEEEPAQVRWPVFCLSNFGSPTVVERGDFIGLVGNAGFSTGKHLHYEIHQGFVWDRWEDRLDPEAIDWERR